MSRLHRPMKVRLAGWHEVLVHAVMLGLVASGAVWLLFQYWLAPDAMGTHPAQAWSLRVHGALAMLTLVVAGSLLPVHATGAWQQRRNRRSGTLLLLVTTTLAVTAWGLYYAGSPELRAAASLVHWVVGLLTPLLLCVHVLLGRRSGRRAARG
jgi:cation transport ATPase